MSTIFARLLPAGWGPLASASAIPAHGSAARAGALAEPQRWAGPSYLPPPPQPTPEPKAPPTLRQRLGTLLVWLLLAAGWGVFVAWWVIVLRRESFAALSQAMLVIGVSVAAIAVGTSVWIRHNKRLAQHGSRGRSSLYIPMQWEHDALGRPVKLPIAMRSHPAAELSIQIEGDTKYYIVQQTARP